MSKRKFEFDDSDDYGEGEGVGFKKYHSLDSDEEEEDKNSKYDVLANDDVEGQEASTVDYDGDTKITPFNMQEEMEEGHFDKDGNYFFHKDKDEIKDHWLDNIDLVKVAPNSVQEAFSDNNVPVIDEIAFYKEMLKIMLPGENVIKAIKRLGGTGKKVSDRWKKKKTEESKSASEENSENKEKLLKLTELADQLLHSGKFEIYQATYEKIAFTLNILEGGCNSSIEAKEENGTTSNKKSDVLDIFADDVNQEILEKKEESVATTTDFDNTIDSEIKWEFKWENTDDAPVYGPHTSMEMHQWEIEDYFPNGVWVRRTNQPEAPFYNSKRIDFELYY